MGKVIVLLPKRELELATKFARTEEVHLCINFGLMELPNLGSVIYGDTNIEFKPCEKTVGMDIKMKGNVPFNELVNWIKQRLSKISGEEVEVKLYETKLCIWDKEKNKPVKYPHNKVIGITFHLVDGEPVVAYTYDYELHIPDEITDIKVVKELFNKCRAIS